MCSEAKGLPKTLKCVAFNKNPSRGAHFENIFNDI